MSKPVNEADETCPFHQKPVKKVCHKCPLYQQIRGFNPNTGAEVDYWGCSLGFLPTLLIDNTNQQRQTGAAVESFRNETVKGQAVIGTLMLQAAENREKPDPKLIEG